MLLAREKPLNTKTSLPWRLASLSALAGAVALAASLAGIRPAAGQTEPPATPPAGTLPAATDPALPPPVTAPVPVPLPPLGIVDFSVPLGGTPRITVPALGPAPVAFELPGESPANSDEAALLAEIKQLQDKLRALETKRSNTKPAENQSSMRDKIQSNQRYITQRGAKHIVMIHIDEQGMAWQEMWQTDEQGRLAKIMSRAPATSTEPVTSLIAEDGKTITMEFTSSTGSRVTQVLDAATGKLIESVPSPGKGEPTAEPRLTPPLVDPNVPQNPAAPRTTTPRRSELRFPTPIMPGAPTASAPVDEYNAVARPAGEPNMARGAQQLDLVSLATSYADAVGVLEAAQARVDENAKLSNTSAISQHEVRNAKLALSAAQRKEQILRSIAEVATDNAAQEFERSSQLHKAGQTTASAPTEAKTRLEILKQIFRMRPAESAPKK